MSPRRLLVLVFTGLSLAQLLPVGAAPLEVGRTAPGPGRPGREDRHGDPLPAEAVARLGTVRFRNGGFLSSLAYTPDGRFLVSGGVGGARVWEAATGKEVRRLGGEPPHYCRPASLSPDGKLVAVGGWGPDGGGAVYHLATGRPVYRFEQSSVTDIPCFSPDGKVLASSTGLHVISLNDAATGKPLRWLRGYEIKTGNLLNMTGIAFTPDSKTLVSAGGDGTIRLWDVATGKERRRLSGGADGVCQIALSPDGALLASVAYTKIARGGGGTFFPGNRVRLWDLASGKEVRQVIIRTAKRYEGRPMGPQLLAFTPDGKALLTGGPDNALRVWDPATGKELRRFADYRGGLGAVTFAPGGKVFAMAEGHTIRVRDFATGRDLVPAGGHRHGVWAVAVSPDRGTVATGGQDGTVCLWDPTTGREWRRLAGHQAIVCALAFSAEGQILFSAGYDSVLRVWDSATGKELRRFKRPLQGPIVLALSPDGKTLAAAGLGPGVLLLDGATGRELRTLNIPGARLTAVAFSADSRTLLAWGPQELHRWHLGTGKHLRQSCAGLGEETRAVVFSPDGRLVAFGGQQSPIPVVDVATGGEVCRFDNLPLPPNSAVSCLAFSPDGRTLAWSRQEDAMVRLGEVATGQERHRLAGHRGGVASLVFSADGKFLVSGSMDTTALVWDLTGPLGATEGGPAPLPEGGLASCWEELGSEDAARAYAALRRLSADPAPLPAARGPVPWLGRRLRPVAAVEGRRLAGLVADLDGDSFAAREKAMHELAGLGEGALPGLREALKGDLSAEVRRRIARLEEELPLQVLHSLRAVEALEHIGNAEAKGLLRRLARGMPEARLTQEARASLGRLERRLGRSKESNHESHE
jgi:WD40 repeat protein